MRFENRLTTHPNYKKRPFRQRVGMAFSIHIAHLGHPRSGSIVPGRATPASLQVLPANTVREPSGRVR